MTVAEVGVAHRVLPAPLTLDRRKPALTTKG